MFPYFQLVQITRLSETAWETKSVLPVSFASLIVPLKEKSSDAIQLRELLMPFCMSLLDLIFLFYSRGPSDALARDLPCSSATHHSQKC
jgi:hypothetical protein